MKLLLGINLLLAVVVLTFLLLREDGRAPDQTQISRVATTRETSDQGAKRPTEDDTDPQRRELPTAKATGDKPNEHGAAATTTNAPQSLITGVVLDEKGQAFPGVGVYAGRHYTGWLRPDPTSHLKPPKASTRTDAAGRFATTGYRDPWTPISFVIQGYLPLDLMLTSADEARTLRLTLQAAATLEVRDFPRFTEVKGKQYPLTIWNLQAIRLNGSYALWKDRPLLQKGLREALPSQEEHFRVPDLPPGRYRIRLLSTERVVDRKLKKAIQIFVDREIELRAGKTSKFVWK